MARVTPFSTWLNNVLDHEPDIGGRALKEKWAEDHPHEDFPSHGLSALSQSKKRRSGGSSSKLGRPPKSAADQHGPSDGHEARAGGATPRAALDRLAKIVSEYQKIKEENEDLKRRLIEIADQVK